MNKDELRKQFGNGKDIKVLMKYNELVKAKYSLTLVQNRVFELLLYIGILYTPYELNLN